MKIRFEMTAKEFSLISTASSKMKKRFDSVKKTLSVLLFGPKEETKANLVSKIKHNKSIQIMANISEEKGAILEIHVAENYAVKASELFCRYMETYISAAEAIVPLIGVYANRLKEVITEAAELESQNNVEIYQLAPNVFMDLEVLRELNIAYDTTFNNEGQGKVTFQHLGTQYWISVDARDFDSNRELYNSDTNIHILGIDSSGDLVSDVETLRDYDLIWTSVRN